MHCVMHLYNGKESHHSWLFTTLKAIVNMKKRCWNLFKIFKKYIKDKHTLLTKIAVSIDDNETFYLYSLMLYSPSITKSTFKENQLGLGIYTMKGFERRNKESIV